MKKTCTVLAALVGLVGFSVGALAGEHMGAHKGKAMKAEVGKKAPDFTLRDVDGKEHKLADLKGKVVVLEWTNHLCPFVVRHQKQRKTMQKTYDMFKDQDIAWLAIDSTRPDYQGKYDVKSIKEWANSDDVKLPYPVLRDKDGKVGHMYGAQTTPDMFVIDKEGVLVYKGAIDDDPSGSKTNATNYVAQAIKAALNGSTVEIASTKPYGCSVKYQTK
jgi:peroxiredoxin